MEYVFNSFCIFWVMTHFAVEKEFIYYVFSYSFGYNSRDLSVVAFIFCVVLSTFMLLFEVYSPRTLSSTRQTIALKLKKLNYPFLQSHQLVSLTDLLTTLTTTLTFSIWPRTVVCNDHSHDNHVTSRLAYYIFYWLD